MSTPGAAPTLDALNDFEGQLEAAARAVLKLAGLTVLDPVVYRDPTSEEPLVIPDDGVWPEVDIGGSNGGLGFKAPGGSEDEWNEFEGTLRVSGSVPFTAPATTGGQPDLRFLQTLRTRRAKCRTLFMQSRTPFPAELLPWLDILLLQPLAPQKRPDQARGVNTFILDWRLRFCIRSTAWPSGA